MEIVKHIEQKNRYRVMIWPGGIVNVDDLEAGYTIYQSKNQLFMETLAEVLNLFNDNGFEPSIQITKDGLAVNVSFKQDNN